MRSLDKEGIWLSLRGEPSTGGWWVESGTRVIGGGVGACVVVTGGIVTFTGSVLATGGGTELVPGLGFSLDDTEELCCDESALSLLMGGLDTL